jgi:uncharacterized protein (TIGR02217 family)
MAYIRTYIPACETFGWNGGPEFKTRRVEMANGRERRNGDWSQPRHSFILPFANIDPGTYAGIKQTHLLMRGMLHNFLYQDRLDFAAENELFAVAAAGQDEFQPSKLTTQDGVSYQRNVYALYVPAEPLAAEAVQSTPQITVDGAPASGWTFDYDRGLAFPPAPMVGDEVLRWSGQFSLWVRFNQDALPFSIDNKSQSGFAINGQVELMEYAAPEPDEGS